MLGKNGAGKSTLFKIISGANKQNCGEILLDGKDISKLPLKDRAKLISYVPQRADFGELTVFETVLTGRLPYFSFKAGRKDYEAVKNVLEEMGISHLAERMANTLSGGEKQTVAIARAIVGNSKLIVFDEPTENLDISNQYIITKTAKELSKKGITVLCSLHDLNEAVLLGDKFFFLKEKKFKHIGGKEIFKADVIEDVYGIKTKVLNIENRTIIIGENVL